MTTALHENRPAFRRESVAPPPTRVAIAYLRSTALPKRRAPQRAACPRGNQRAYQDSLPHKLYGVSVKAILRLASTAADALQISAKASRQRSLHAIVY